MTDILIRNLNPELESLLREKAKATGKSISDVAKALIRKGLVEPSVERGLGTGIRNLLNDQDYVELDIPRDTENLPPPEFQ
jgi:plasmid stability protein